MANIGETLKQARQDKGITLEKAEEETKIRAKYLAALENDDYDVIPGKAYVTGFLKIYAGYLGLNGEEVILAYKSNSTVNENPAPKKTAAETRKYPGPGKLNRKKSSSRLRKYAFMAILAIAAVSTLLLFNDYWSKNRIPQAGEDMSKDKVEQADEDGKAKQNNPDGSESSKNEGQANNGQTQIPNKPDQPAEDNKQQTQPDKVEVVLKIKDQDSWVKVIVDGQTIFTGTMTPGQQKSFDAREEIRLVLGNAGAVEVTYNGQNLGSLGPIGKVIKKEFTKSM